MRRLLVVLGLLASMSDAFAGGEFETLRGSAEVVVPVAPAPPVATIPRWGGFYLGGQIGYSQASVDFQGATESLVAHMLRELALQNEVAPSTWDVLGKANTGRMSYGGFIGFNNRWESVILGFEFNYTRTALDTASPISPITRVTSAGGNTYLLTVSGNASMNITEYGTFRGRAGWEAGNFLPYGMLGLAVGRADISRTANAFGQENPNAICPGAGPPPCTPFSFTETSTKNGAFIYGWSIGGGLDVMVMPRVFLRTEFEYVIFGATSEIRSSIASARAGLGFKF